MASENGTSLDELTAEKDFDASGIMPLDKTPLPICNLGELGPLIQSIAHENQQLLSVAAGFLSFTERFPESSSIQKPLKRIKTILSRLIDLNSQLGKIGSRLNGNADRHLAMVNPNERINDIVGLLKYLIASNIFFEIFPAGNIWQAQIPEDRFDRLLMNLISACRKVLPLGGTIAIHTRNTGPESPISNRTGCFVCILFSCISKAREPRDSAGFYRDESLCPGLVIARRIAEEVKGWIKTETGPECEPTIRVFIPARPGQ